MPASASVMEKSAAISTSKPIGMNSDVFITNAQHAKPASANHSLRCIIFPSYRTKTCRRFRRNDGTSF